LEELLGCSVDLVRMRDNMNTTLKKRIQNEGIYI
jgi:predicted nucleotidyltransferase